MSTFRSAILLAVLVSVAACKDNKEQANKAAAAPVAPAAASSAPREIAREASSPPPALDDLLHFTDARIGVSSKVANPRDFAEHVADGRLDTAWNGKTGDLVGGWIGFRVPEEARVTLIELTVGYVAKSKKGEDLFDLNHRIARVRLTRNGASLGERALDPDSRAFQRIALDAEGGDFKLEVLAVKPGSRAAWKELVVSELRVFGAAGAAKRSLASIPHVIVGSLDAPPAALATVASSKRPKTATIEVTRATDANPDLECGNWTSPLTFRYRQMMDGGLPSSVPWEPPEPSCDFAVKKTRGDVKLVVFSRTDEKETYREPAIGVGDRLFLVGRRFDQQSHFDPHCSGTTGAKMHSARIESDDAIFEIYGWTISNAWPTALEDGGIETTPGFSERSLEEIRCAIGAKGATPTCTSKTLEESRIDAADPSVADGPPPRPWK
jgi:hypothetical protein